mmetsp:Transcript_59851/g.160233  ORF Transcript_59851/g.160233 Transcript_59851/m.160233 type:complete len:478 (+) Transcript_59851:42-1475(+)
MYTRVANELGLFSDSILAGAQKLASRAPVALPTSPWPRRGGRAAKVGAAPEDPSRKYAEIDDSTTSGQATQPPSGKNSDASSEVSSGREPEEFWAHRKLGDEVEWAGADADIPRGSIGVIVSKSVEDGTAKVKFPNGIWQFHLCQLLEAKRPEKVEIGLTVGLPCRSEDAERAAKHSRGREVLAEAVRTWVVSVLRGVDGHRPIDVQVTVDFLEPVQRFFNLHAAYSIVVTSGCTRKVATDLLKTANGGPLVYGMLDNMKEADIIRSIFHTFGEVVLEGSSLSCPTRQTDDESPAPAATPGRTPARSASLPRGVKVEAPPRARTCACCKAARPLQGGVCSVCRDRRKCAGCSGVAVAGMFCKACKQDALGHSPRQAGTHAKPWRRRDSVESLKRADTKTLAPPVSRSHTDGFRLPTSPTGSHLSPDHPRSAREAAQELSRRPRLKAPLPDLGAVTRLRRSVSTGNARTPLGGRRATT